MAAAAGAAALVAGAGYGLTAQTGIGSGVVPAVAGALLLLGALVWSIELLTARRTAAVPDDHEDEPLPGRADVRRVVTVLLGVIGAAVLLPVLGFTLTMIALLVLLLAGVSGRRVVPAVAVAVAATLAARLVFEGWLGTVLPTSSLPLLSGWGV